MQVAIISDIHDNLANLTKALKDAQKRGVSEIICCGDITNRETLAYLANAFAGPIHLVRGNMELYEEGDARPLNNINYFGFTGRIRLGEKEVGLCHEPKYFDDVLALGSCDIIFYGHTHKPGETNFTRPGDPVRVVNPGNVAGVFFSPTFAVWDTETDEIKLVLIDTLK
jgi:uncharacterized protein